MTEVIIEDNSRRFARGIAENSELTKAVKIIPEVGFREGHEGSVAEFEIFKTLPIKTGFSWGKESGTMSYKWKGESETDDEVRKRIKDFTLALKLQYPGVMHMLGVLEGPQEQIQSLDTSDLEEEVDETITRANFTYTLDPDLAIVIRPADCPISVIYAQTKDGKDLVGLVHSSGVSVNAGIPRMAIEHLLTQEDVDPASIRIGITPGISRINYSISEENTINKNTYPIMERNWKEYIDPKVTDLDTERRHVDILRATVMQYIEAGINPEQIEANGNDTYEAHKNGQSFSHRLYEDSGKDSEVKPGRYMVAVQLSGYQ